MSSRKNRSRGFTIIELTLTLGVMAILAVFAARYMADEAERQVSQAAGAYMGSVGKGLTSYLIQNNADLAAGTPVAGYANPLTPTIPELKAAGRLASSFPLRTPFGQAIAIRITRTACPGVTCRLDALAYSATSLLDNSGVAKYKTVLDIRAATEGGVSADANNPAIMLGAQVGAGGIANPLGAQAGVYGVFASLDSALYPDYVKRFDTRSTTLNADLTLHPANANTVGLTVDAQTRLNGATQVKDSLEVMGGTGACVSMSNLGVVTISCNGLLNATTGMFGTGANSVSINSGGSGALLATGLVTGQTGLATASAQMFTAADPNGIRVKAGNRIQLGYMSAGAPVTMATVEGGDVVASKNVAGMRLSLQEVVVMGAVCTPTSGVAGTGKELAMLSTGGIGVCEGGKWVALQSFAVHQDACAVDGAFSVDSATGKQMVCRSGRWMWANSFLSPFVLQRTILVADGNSVTKPTCDATGSLGAGQPLLLLQATVEGSPDASFNRYGTDMGSDWLINLRDGDNNALVDARAIALLYCWYP